MSSENNLERNEKAPDINNRIEEIKNSLEEMKIKEPDNANIFLIIVEILAGEGIPLPSPKLADIKELYVSNESSSVVVVRFTDGVTILFNHDSSVTVKIKEEIYLLNDEEADEYRKKYYEYAHRFLEIKKSISSNSSDLAAKRLHKMGI